MRHRGRIEAAIQKVLILLLSCTSYNPVNHWIESLQCRL
jgi:hypothetical protein